MVETPPVQTKTNNRQLTAKERFWFDHYRRWQQSGQSLAGYARKHGLVVKTFYGWHDKLKKRGLAKPEPAPTVFHRVTVKPTEPSPDTKDGLISLRFRLPNGIDCEACGIKPSSYAGLLEILARLRL